MLGTTGWPLPFKYVRLGVRLMKMHVRSYIHTQARTFIHIHMHMCTQTCTFIHTHASTCVCVHVCVSVCTFMHTHTHIHEHTHVLVCVCVCVCVCVYVAVCVAFKATHRDASTRASACVNTRARVFMHVYTPCCLLEFSVLVFV